MSGPFCWSGIAVSVIGNDHVKHELPLQDASAAILSPRPAAVVCDGAGSAALSHEGANAAVRAFRIAVAAMEPLLGDALDSDRTPWGFADDLWRYAAGWICRALVAAKNESARSGSGNPRDYEFTFAATIVGRLRTGFIQVGDGAICVCTQGGRCDLVFKPEKGRFSNATKFLDGKVVEEDGYMTRILPTAIVNGLMIMSDGPAVNMLDIAAARPAPIVAQMVADFREGEADRSSLLNYLTGSRWMRDPRGGDDKSIVILAKDYVNENKKGEKQ